MDKGGLPYEFEQAAEYSVLALKPAMNNSEWSDIEQAGDAVLGELESAGTPHLIVDLSELNYIGSAMVALLVRFWKIVKAKNARMVVVIRDPMVLEVLQIAKLDQVWEIAEYREDALYELGLSPEAKSERRESNVLVMASVIPALIAAAALGVYLASPGVLGIRLTQNPRLWVFRTGIGARDFAGGESDCRPAGARHSLGDRQPGRPDRSLRVGPLWQRTSPGRKQTRAETNWR